jgi:hypothetical protein
LACLWPDFAVTVYDGRAKRVYCRGARWHIFKPKIPIWVNFEGSCDEMYWYIFGHFGIFYGHLVYFMVILYIFGHLVYFWPLGILVYSSIWYIVPVLGMLYEHEKSGNPELTTAPRNLNLFLESLLKHIWHIFSRLGML